ncbi:hypothetical protein ABMX69_10990 [Vibrio vulnificus]|uniref:hypothetical protein n=1 Tax=Vibrio vulnificus TaxID=672 RepID=UPI000CD1CF43|nr:hypothetical protein CRN41_10730 [Vibrio vulnificus]
MSYCKNALVIAPEMNIRDVLNLLSRAKFHAGRAVQCESNKNQFMIDNGMNNVRAVINREVGLILFNCRYEQYIKGMDIVIEDFAAEQALSIKQWKA